jgi:hypothetical protein
MTCSTGSLSPHHRLARTAGRPDQVLHDLTTPPLMIVYGGK